MEIQKQATFEHVGSPARRLAMPANLVLAFGCLILVAPTMFQVARQSWATEQGGHGHDAPDRRDISIPSRWWMSRSASRATML